LFIRRISKGGNEPELHRGGEVEDLSRADTKRAERRKRQPTLAAKLRYALHGDGQYAPELIPELLVRKPEISAETRLLTRITSKSMVTM